jgi:hypothetical protein
MPNISQNKNLFKSTEPIQELSDREEAFLANLLEVLTGVINEGVIALLPYTKESLYIDIFKVIDIGRKHGDVPLENLIITANRPTFIIRGYVDELPFITLVYELPGGGFVLSSRKFNGHYVVTFFEAADSKYIESIKRRGEVRSINNEKPPG